MSSVSDAIVREFFEAHGFFVHQPRKYAVSSRPKRPDEEIDLMVSNPNAEGEWPSAMIWGAEELKSIPRAIVGVRGWHSDRFSPAMVELSPEVTRFAREDSVRRATQILGPGPTAKILCLPGLSASDDLQRRTLGMLKDRGVDGIISFRTMLMDLVRRVEASKNYERSDLLQTIRILKTYDLLKGAQLDLFRTGTTRRRRAMKKDGNASP